MKTKTTLGDVIDLFEVDGGALYAEASGRGGTNVRSRHGGNGDQLPGGYVPLIKLSKSARLARV